VAHSGVFGLRRTTSDGRRQKGAFSNFFALKKNSRMLVGRTLDSRFQRVAGEFSWKRAAVGDDSGVGELLVSISW